MKTKHIVVKATNRTHDALKAVDIYSDSPHYLFLLCEWIVDAESCDEIQLTGCLNIIDSKKREEEADKLCDQLEKIGVSFYRVFSELRFFNVD